MACLRREGWLHDEIDALDPHKKGVHGQLGTFEAAHEVTFRSAKDGVKDTEERVLPLRWEARDCLDRSTVQ